MIVLDAVTVTDAFPNENAQQPAAIMFPAVKSSGGYFTIQNNPVYVQLAYNIAPGGYGYGQSRWTKQIPFPTGPGIILPGTVGIRFKNYTPGSAAIVSGALAEQAEPSIEVTSSGAIPTGSTALNQLAYTEFNATFTATSTAEGSAVTVVSAGSVTFDGLTKVLIEVFAPRFTSDNNSPGDGGYLALFDTVIGTPIGRVAFGQTAGQGGPLIMKRFLTPSAGSHTYFAGIYDAGTASTHATISGGGGGATTLIPGYIRITSGS